MKSDVQPNNVYKLQGTTMIGGVAVSAELNDKTEHWHQGQRCMSQGGMQELYKESKAEGVSICKLNFCKDDSLGKLKVAFKLVDRENKSIGLLNHIHSEVRDAAPVRCTGLQYSVTFLDDFSRRNWTCFMKEKSGVLFKVKRKVGNPKDRRIKGLRSNGDSEYRMKRFLPFYTDGVTRRIMVKDNLQENMAAGRMKEILFEREREKERSMRLHGGLTWTLWKEVNHAFYLVNRSPSEVLNFKCAEEVWSREPAGYSNLRVFGSSAYVHTLGNDKTKLKPNSLVIEKGVKGCKLWNIFRNKEVLSRYVIDDEKTMPFNEVETSEVKKTDVVKEATEVPLTQGIMEETPAQVEQIEQVEHDRGVIEEEVLEQQQQSHIQAQVEKLILRTYDSVRQSLEREFQKSIALDMYALSFSPGNPTTYREAIAKYIRESWMGAMFEQKKKSIQKDLVRESVPKPKERHQIGCEGVYRKREGIHDEEAMRFKSRVLAKKYTQKEKVEYDQISPAEKCVYNHVFKDSMVLLSGDMLTTCQEKRKFEKDLGAAQHILEVKIRRDKEAGKLWLLFEPVSTPPVAHFQLSVQGSSTMELDEKMQVFHARVVGCLKAQICTRPSFAQVLSIVSKYVASLGRRHWQEVAWILYYLGDTKKHGFLFERQQEQACIFGQEDSDLAGDLDKRRSISSIVITCSTDSGSCRATIESTKMLSTTQEDCITLKEASVEALWLNGLMNELGIQQVVVNNRVMNLTRNQVFQEETKHIDVRDHRREGWISSGKITTEKVHSRENVSDCLTRTIAMEKFKQCLNLLSITTC